MKIVRLEFQGDGDEYERVRHLFESTCTAERGAAPTIEAATRRTNDGPTHEHGTNAAAPEVAFFERVLTRIPVPEGQRLVFRAVASAGNTGVNRTDLAAQIGRSPSQLDGIFGALGHRVMATSVPGALRPQGTSLFFEISRDGGQNWYRLRPAARQALERQGLL